MKKRSEAGFSLLDVLGALVIVAVLLPTLSRMGQIGYTEIRKRQAADHLAKVNTAAAAYVRKHHERLVDESSPASGPTITVADLIREEFLPSGFRNINVWGQGYTVFIREPRAEELQAVTLTSGGLGTDDRDPSFAHVVVPSASTLLGGAGGFIPSGNIAGQQAGTLHGAFGGYVLDLASLGIASPGPGHLGAVSSFDASTLAQDFLYRVNVPGHPELNAMQTELDMTDHAIERVKEVQFVPHTLAEMDTFCGDPSQNGRFFLHEGEGLYICRDGKVQTVADTGNSLMMKNMTLASHGERIQKPHCPPGVDTRAEIFLSPVTYSAQATLSPPVVSVQTWADDLSDTEWQVNLRLMTADPRNPAPVWVYPTADLAQMMVMTLCRSNEGVTP